MANIKTHLTAAMTIAMTMAMRVSLRVLNWRLLALYAPFADAAETSADEGSPLVYLSGLIDIRIATAVSVLSLIILAGLRQADFKGRFGMWVGRFIVFLLVILNIGLWSTQV